MTLTEDGFKEAADITAQMAETLNQAFVDMRMHAHGFSGEIRDDLMKKSGEINEVKRNMLELSEKYRSKSEAA